MLAPHLVPTRPPAAPPADPLDSRLRDRLRPWDGTPREVLFLGIPSDDGVVAGGGRAGAAEGPRAFREAVLRYGTTWDAEHELDWSDLTVADAGDAEVVAGDVATTHDHVTACAASLFERCDRLVVVGGGNDATFATLRALGPGTATAVINVDAHLDVRRVIDGRITSGTPYRRLIEEHRLPGRNLVEFAAHPHVNSRSHHDWVRSRGAACHTLDAVRSAGAGTLTARELDRLSLAAPKLAVSIDLDVFAAAYAPGVSAPGVDGLTPEEGRQIAWAAGLQRRVRLFELVELSPPHDLDGRTARLAVMLACSFLAGVAAARG
ncbi:MAG: arginase family protein [Polyangiaceae bacterium]|nr:arginase family protein [Polyangiaceae bacterium]